MNVIETSAVSLLTVVDAPALAGAPALQSTPLAVEVSPLVAGRIHRTNLRKFLGTRQGRFVSVDYVKQDGTARTLTGRVGVTKFLKGGKNNVEAVDRPYFTMFDMNVAEYRTINLATVSKVRAERTEYAIVD